MALLGVAAGAVGLVHAETSARIVAPATTAIVRTDRMSMNTSGM
jgi:hypothetical protein